MNTATDARAEARRIAARNRHRNTTCSGCRHNYYNFGKEKSPNGDVAVPQDYSCWYVTEIGRRKKCPMHSGGY